MEMFILAFFLFLLFYWSAIQAGLAKIYDLNLWAITTIQFGNFFINPQISFKHIALFSPFLTGPREDTHTHTHTHTHTQTRARAHTRLTLKEKKYYLVPPSGFWVDSKLISEFLKSSDSCFLVFFHGITKSAINIYSLWIKFNLKVSTKLSKTITI